MLILISPSGLKKTELSADAIETPPRFALWLGSTSCKSAERNSTSLIVRRPASCHSSWQFLAIFPCQSHNRSGLFTFSQSEAAAYRDSAWDRHSLTADSGMMSPVYSVRLRCLRNLSSRTTV